MRSLFCAMLLTLPAAQGWTPLFDGHSLDGWHMAARAADRGKAFWKVEDGALLCDSLGRPDHDYVWLVRDGEYGDFELKLKVRSFPNSPGNSGVQVRSRYDGAAEWMDGPQVDINPPAAWRTGLIYDETRGAQRWIFPSLPNWNIDVSRATPGWKWDENGWNAIEIRCRGTRIETTVNGVRIADYDGRGLLDDAAHRQRNVGLRGHIALQLHMKDELRIAFKDILIRPLP